LTETNHGGGYTILTSPERGRHHPSSSAAAAAAAVVCSDAQNTVYRRDKHRGML